MLFAGVLIAGWLLGLVNVSVLSFSRESWADASVLSVDDVSKNTDASKIQNRELSQSPLTCLSMGHVPQAFDNARPCGLRGDYMSLFLWCQTRPKGEAGIFVSRPCIPGRPLRGTETESRLFR